LSVYNEVESGWVLHIEHPISFSVSFAAIPVPKSSGNTLSLSSLWTENWKRKRERIDYDVSPVYIGVAFVFNVKAAAFQVGSVSKFLLASVINGNT